RCESPLCPRSHSNTRYLFCINHTATPQIYTLSLHDALPILDCRSCAPPGHHAQNETGTASTTDAHPPTAPPCSCVCRPADEHLRSEEHTSELQSLAYLVCRLLLEKKNYHVLQFCSLLPHNHH